MRIIPLKGAPAFPALRTPLNAQYPLDRVFESTAPQRHGQTCRFADLMDRRRIEFRANSSR